MNNSHEITRRVSWRIIPLMFILYIFAYLDRINVGFASLQMNHDLKFDPAIYGLGSGIFFVGYFIFEVPSNLILRRVGARIWIARIMFTWGILASSMMFVRSPLSFYTVRFLLGLAEAGFFPGMILYLTYWYPPAERARAVALFMTATALAGVIGGPVSGAILTMRGLAGLAGWQWLFLLEGIPSILLGFVVLAYLPNGPQDARWLQPVEQAWVKERLQGGERVEHRGLLQAFSDPRVWLLCLVYFTFPTGAYSLSFWMPQMIKAFHGLSDLEVGFLSAIPYLVGTVSMVLIGANSDRTGERRWHLSGSFLIAALGIALAAFVHSPMLSILALSVAAVGLWGGLGPFWAIPTAFLGETAAAGGIALINSVGNLGGFIGPYAIGYIKNITHSFTAGLLAVAAVLALGSILALIVGQEERTSGKTSTPSSAIPTTPAAPASTASAAAEPGWKQIKAEYDSLRNSDLPFNQNVEAKFWPNDKNDRSITAKQVVNALSAAGFPYEDKSDGPDSVRCRLTEDRGWVVVYLNPDKTIYMISLIVFAGAKSDLIDRVSKTVEGLNFHLGTIATLPTTGI